MNTIRVFATPIVATFANLNGVVMVPPPPAPPQRAYVSTAGTPIDVPGTFDGDCATLVNAGYVAIALSGTTAARPTNTGLLKPGLLYVDTTLSAVIFWDGANWRNAVTGAIA
jgi:hypothetical protein